MNRKNKISTGKLLRSIILLLMMGWMGSAWAQTEKLLYSTDFTEWDKIDRKTTIDKKVTQWTEYSNEELTFTLNGVGVDPKGTNSKFPNYTGYMITAKYPGEYIKSEPSAVTSPLNSITKIVLTQAATGPSRGIKVSVMGDGDADWVTIHNASIVTASGEDLTLNVNRTNCKIKFETFTLNQNAYIVDLKIYGNVEVKSNYTVTYYDTDGTTSLGSESVTANSNLKYNTEYTSQVKQNVPSGSAFRGWFYGTDPSAEKVAEGTPVDMDLNLYAKVTPIETATDGSEYTYDLTKNNFYQEDHELIEINGGKYHNDGWIFENEGTILLKVAKNAHIEMTTSTGTTTRDYTGGVPTTLTLDIPAGTVVKNLQVKNYIPVYVSFDLKDNQGQCPEQILCEPSTGKAKLPSNNLIYREGYTFTGWTDANETKIYPAGEEVVFTESTTLHPMMVQNTIDITDTNTRLTVSWDFDHTKAPALSSKKWSSKTMPYTHTVTIENEKRDITLMMDVTTSGAKIENTDSEINDFEGEGGQFNNGTQFSLPAVYGMTLTIYASTKVDNRYNISTNFGTAEDDAKVTVSDGTNHIDGTISEDKKSITFTYNGDEKNINIQIVQAGIKAYTWGFFRNISVTYPVLPNVVITKTISNADTYPNEKPENAGTVEITKQTTEGNTGARYKVGDKVTITTTPSTCYTFQEFKQGDNSLAATSSFEYTVQKGINNIEVIYERQKLYQVVVKPSDPSLGTVSLSPKYDNFYNEKYNDKGEVTQIECWYTEGTEVVATGEAITDYMLDYWKKEDGTLSNGISYSFTVETSNQTLTAHFALGHLGSVNFVIPDGLLVNGKDQKKDFKNAISVTPNSMNNVRSFTIPTNYTLFKSIGDNGNAVEQYYTLRHWKDDKNNIYELGTTHSFGKEGDIINLVPVFEQNLATQNNRTNNPVIRYDFARKVKEYDDPTKKETRKVCAQPVNIGKDQQVFWTTKVWVEVREAGKDKPHWRDVALWCDTGKKGYIKNGQFDNWCAFGPGTTLWFPSGTGTKISLMSYSKITSTTIDDSVPTLDRERTNSERKKAGLPTLEEEENGEKSYMYVYTHTTQNPNLRPAIKIGDDYSYYQWLELSTLAANWVVLHTETNDDSRGIINKKDIQPVITGESHERRELEDGDLAFHKGERIKMTFNRKKGYELDKIVDLDKLDENGEPIAVLKMNDNGTVNMVGFDDGTTTTPVPKNEDGSWGTAGSTVFVLRKAEKNQSGKDQSGKECYLTSDNIRTRYELEFDITNHRNLQICFKEMKNTYYITYNAGDKAEGTSPEATWVEHGDQYVIPTNKTLYYEGNTLDHWVDGAGNVYEIGKPYNAPEKFIRMFPVFKPNEFNILNLQQEATATWHFAKNDGAPTINYEGTKGILVTQLETENPEKAGEKLSIDLKITLDGSNGKFNNVSSVDHPERIQINQGSIVEFPSTKDCVAKWTATVDGKKLTIAGETVTLSNQEASVTCSGASSIQKVEFNQGDGAYSKSFSVTYKKQDATKATIESLTCKDKTLKATEILEMMNGTDKCVTFTLSPWENDNDTIPAVTGTATENGTVTVTKATILSPECVATVKTQSGIVVETYPIKFIFEKPTVAPTLNSLTVNGTTYTGNNIELNDVPRSGVIKLNFNRPMKATNFTYGDVTSSTAIGKEQIIKYWDLPSEGTVTLKIMPTGDIYGGAYGQVITLTLNVAREETIYHRHTFDFIVGRDGNMDEAIKAANNNNKTDHRYYIFVPDGEYQLTGNTKISCSTDPKKAPVDENGDSRPDMNGQNNHMTDIIKSNISLIGQSKEGVTIWNRPIVEGISYTATLNLVKDTKDFYAQDLTLENQFKYWGALGGSSGAGRAVAFCDRGNRSVLKNVALKSYQDTYYSSNSNADYRGYFENCDLAGVVDWICGNGDIWFEKCNLIVRDRTGNNIVASGTEKNQAWGYVFNNCTIRPETDKPTQFKGNDWTLARPWNNSPACTFLNTKMYTQPQTYGWNKMTEGLVVRFHEYNSVDESDTPIPLATRSLAACSPAPGSDDCILTNTSDYNIRNVMSGTDAFEPQELCKQIDAESGLQSKKDEELEDKEKVDTENHIIWKDSISTNDNLLQWKHQKEALCYFIFKLDEETGKWIYKVNTIENQINLNDYGNGFYCIRAANQRGGLGGATKAIEYVLADPYKLEIKKIEGYMEGKYGWSTICLPFNAKVPTEVIAYAATAHNHLDETTQITDLTMTLTPVTVINANKGYVVYGQEGKHYFHPTSNESSAATILKGNPKNEAIPVENNKGYVLSYKSTWGIGFYKFTGSTLAANRAWLPKEMVSQNNQDNLALGKQNIRFAIAPGATSIASPTLQKKDEKEIIYNLNGQRVDKASARGGIFISSQKGKFYKAPGSSGGRR